MTATSSHSQLANISFFDQSVAVSTLSALSSFLGLGQGVAFGHTDEFSSCHASLVGQCQYLISLQHLLAPVHPPRLQ